MKNIPKRYAHMIDSVEDASESDDGYFIYLKDGFADMIHDLRPCHTIHEWEEKLAWLRMKDVKRCICKDCCQ